MCPPSVRLSSPYILRRPATRDIEIGLPAPTGSRPRDGTPIQQRKDEEKARIERNEACEKMTALTKELCEDEDETISSSEWDAKKQQLYALVGALSRKSTSTTATATATSTATSSTALALTEAGEPSASAPSTTTSTSTSTTGSFSGSDFKGLASPSFCAWLDQQDEAMKVKLIEFIINELGLTDKVVGLFNYHHQ